MDTSLIFIYIIGALLVLFLFRYILVAQNILGAALKRASAQLIRQSDCPSYLQEFYALKEGELQDLGFHFSHCLLVDDLYVKKDTKRYYYVYYNPAKKTYAHLTACPEADRYIPFWVSFYTYFENGKKLVTVNGIRHTIMDTIPDSFKQKVMAFLKKRYPTIYRHARQHGEFPQYFPIRYFLVTDSKIYVLTFKTSNYKNELYILDLEGKLLGKTMVPFEEAEFLQPYPFTIGKGVFYQLNENLDTEEWELHIHQIH